MSLVNILGEPLSPSAPTPTEAAINPQCQQLISEFVVAAVQRGHDVSINIVRLAVQVTVDANGVTPYLLIENDLGDDYQFTPPMRLVTLDVVLKLEKTETGFRAGVGMNALQVEEFPDDRSERFASAIELAKADRKIEQGRKKFPS